MTPKSNITINSALIYVLAFMFSTFFHELAHALIGLWFESGPILHHNYVEHSQFTAESSVYPKVLTALAGPIASLTLGVLSGIVYMRSSNKGLFQLFLLWFAIIGLNNFLGYLMTGPIFSVGDIGKVYALLEWPLGVRIALAVVGAGLLLFMAYKMTRPFLKFSINEEWTTLPAGRKNYSFRILILPWIIGSIIVTLLYLPIIAIISIIYPITSGMIFIFPWQNAVNEENVTASSETKSHEFSYLLALLVLIMASIFRLVLAPGIAL